VKDLIGRFAAVGQGIGGMVMSDEVIKGAMAGYAFEHVEVATYKVLIAAAEHCRDERGLPAHPPAGDRHGRVALRPYGAGDAGIPQSG
jgi:hypothetical protein